MKLHSIRQDFRFLSRDRSPDNPNQVKNLYFQNSTQAQNRLDRIKNIILGFLRFHQYQNRNALNSLLAFQITHFIVDPNFSNTSQISVTDRSNNNILIEFKKNEITAKCGESNIVIAGNLPEDYLKNIINNANIIINEHRIDRRGLIGVRLDTAGVRALIKGGRKDLRGINLEGINLEGVDLRWVRLDTAGPSH